MTVPLLSAQSTVNATSNLVDNWSGWAAETYAGGGFPHREVDDLRSAGLLYICLPGEPLDFAKGGTSHLLSLLKEVGRGNLAVGRIYEGHINALYLIHLYAGTGQRERWYADARAGHLFGVWNTEMRDGISFTAAEDRYVVKGSKSFCSGSIHVTRPIITGSMPAPGGWQMAVIPLDRHRTPVDESFWDPVGMRNSVSHKLDFSDIVLTDEDLVGKPNDYNRQPHFSGGAIRFAAVQLGGAEALLRATTEALQATGYTDNAHQRARVGEMAILIESGKLWLKRAGEVADDPQHDAESTVHYANMTRTAISNYCVECLRLAERSVGVRGFIHPHPVARIYADLTVYLRQPAPDATLEAVGKYQFDAKSSH